MAMINWTAADLDAVFGKDSIGQTPEDRARTSNREFVRGSVQIAISNPRATGRRLSAIETLDAFGSDILYDIRENGFTPIVLKAGEPGKTIANRRASMSLAVDDVASRASISPEDLINFEQGRSDLPYRAIEKICRSLVLDESAIGYQSGSGGDPQLGVRFKEFISGTEDIRPMSGRMLVHLAEASWVIRKQLALQVKLGYSQRETLHGYNFTHNSDYKYPCYSKGYMLAARTRNALGLGELEPIESLTHLIEETLLIPVVSSEFTRLLAGATVSPTDDGRGILLNVTGYNSNVWVRRVTLAHELAHLLWDPASKLNGLVVDEYEALSRVSTESPAYDEVEARANAFAAEFLAPRKGVELIFKKYVKSSEGLRAVMENYGVSYSTARWQLINSGLMNAEDYPQIDTEHTEDWVVREEATLGFFPITSVPSSRRGKFFKVVMHAVFNRLISDDTAAFCLDCSLDEFMAHKGDLETLADITR